MSVEKKINFGAGPAKLPEEVSQVYFIKLLLGFI